MSLVTELTALGRRYLTRTGEEFAEAVAAGDLERADAAIGEAAELAAALNRQERAARGEIR